MKVGVVVPVYCDKSDNWKSIWSETMIPSLVHISNVDNLEFLYNFQKDQFRDEDKLLIQKSIDKALSMNSTWSAKIQFRSYYDDPVSMVVIRNDCMKLDPEVPLYLSIDDDHKFNPGAGDCYNEIIEFFGQDPQLGMVMSAGYLGGYNYKHKLKYAVKKHWMTCRGQFFRNLHKSDDNPVYSKEALTYCKAGYEDMVIAMEILANGYKLATHFNNPTTAKATRMESAESSSSNDRYDEDKIHNVQATFSAMEEYIYHRYGIEASIKSIKDFQPVLERIYIISQ